ncbi:MAG: glucose-1-phosphate thymidylyltransferase [Bacteroidetes bacterium]|nr:MAG: glucose-1-phosphate thymidylyltransferase [Bacteroidota bacterium]
MNFILYDGRWREHLLPFTYTRPIGEIRVGITTIREKWELLLKTRVSFLTQEYLQQKYPLVVNDNNIVIESSIIPTEELIKEILALNKDEMLTSNGEVVAIRCETVNVNDNPFKGNYKLVEKELEYNTIHYPWHIYKLNPEIIQQDFKRITEGRKSVTIPEGVFVSGDPDLLFIEEGADVKYAYINTEEGPVYIGKNARVMEGSKIRGPFALCNNATVKMGAKIYEGSTVGPWSKVGGEVNNSVIFGYSSKSHDGYLGNSVIGEWCNLGADTNTSNLKNTYEDIRVWSFTEQSFINTGEQFCGLLMGDHSKSGINTMFNTGTVVGVFCNIYGAGYQRNLIPSFSWGGTQGFKLYHLNKVYKVAEAVMKRRDCVLDETEKNILAYLHQNTVVRK